MGRGVTAVEGATRLSDNGYQYIKVGTVWRLTHHVMAEEKLGRPLTADEGVRFKDGNRRNLTKENLLISKKGNLTVRAQLARVEARITELQGQRIELMRKLGLEE